MAIDPLFETQPKTENTQNVGTMGTPSVVSIPPQPQPQVQTVQNEQPKTETASGIPTTAQKSAVKMPEISPVETKTAATPKATVQVPTGNVTIKQTGDGTAKAEATTQPATTTKTVVNTQQPQQADYYAEATKALQDLLKTGNEQIREAMNKSMEGLFSANQANLSAARMRLNQAGMTGADGSAMLELIARDNGMKANEIIEQLKSEQVKQIIDLDRYGYEGLAKLNEARAINDRENLKTLLEARQYDAASGLWEKVFGVLMDVAALKAADPKTATQVTELLQSAADLEAAGEFEVAKTVRAMAARLNPQLYGTNDPEEAAKIAASIDTTAQQMTVEQQKQAVFRQQIDSAISNWMATKATAAGQTDYAKLKDVVKSSLGATAMGAGDKLRKSMDIDEYNEILGAIGQEPVTVDEYYATDPSEIAINEKIYSSVLKYRANTNAFDFLTSSGVPAAAVMEMAKDEKSWNALEAWTKATLLNPATVKDDGSIDYSKISIGDVSNTVGHFFTDWPIATFIQDGTGGYTVDSYSYDGYNEYGDTNKRNDPNDQYTPYQMKLDKAWESYVLAGTPGDLDRKSWFEVSGGGQLSPKDVGTAIEAQDAVANPPEPEPPKPEGPQPGTIAGVDAGVAKLDEMLGALKPEQANHIQWVHGALKSMADGKLQKTLDSTDPAAVWMAANSKKFYDGLTTKDPRTGKVIFVTVPDIGPASQSYSDAFVIAGMLGRGFTAKQVSDILSTAAGKDRVSAAMNRLGVGSKEYA